MVVYPSHMDFRQVRAPLALLGVIAKTLHSFRYDSFPRLAEGREEPPRKTENPSAMGTVWTSGYDLRWMASKR